MLTALLAAGCLLAVPAAALDQTHGYDGACRSADSNGVTVVIDFQELGGNSGQAAPTLVRCSPVPGNDARVKRTGLQALVDAGVVASGTSRWGDDYPASVPFVCRIEGRPTAAEPLALSASGTSYFEACGDTPPADAYWSYWHANGQGGAWTYSSLGIMNRHVTPGGYEGWSFSLNRDAEDLPVPRVPPVNPISSFTFTADRDHVEVGDEVTLSWKADGASRTVASDSWNGTRLAEGTEIVRPAKVGTFVYTLTAAGAEPNVERSVTITVNGGDSPGVPMAGDPSDSISTSARQSAGWLVNELAPAGQMPGPTAGTDWGLTIDTLWALHAAGTGAKASEQITAEVASHAGTYLGPDLFGDKDARLGGSTAKLLVAAIVAGEDPEAFGRGKYLTKGESYDLRSETVNLLEQSGPQKGRITNRGTGNDATNVFAQSLAVIGLARSGGVPADAVDFLISQQCSSGFFRMYFADRQTCDAGQGVGDGDGTAMGLQALMAARDEGGVMGLDDEIDRGLDWLLSVQHKDGSFSGGAGTEGSNANSTGLIAQTLAAGAEAESGTRAAALNNRYAKARDWVLTVHAHQKTAAGSALDTDREYGAIAYDKSSFSKARSVGIGAAQRDQWRRSTAQAIFALSPVSFANLGKQDLTGDPVTQNHPEDADDDADGGGAAPPPGAGAGAPVGQPVPAVQGASRPVDRLGAYLASQLVDGDHVEVEIEGTTYVDYDATADLLFALNELGGQEDTASKVAAFLLHPQSVRAFAHGAPYEKADAAYAGPLAKLALIARFARSREPKKVPARTLRRLDRALAGLHTADGKLEDTGTYADHVPSVTRQAWIALALTAAENPAADAAVTVLLEVACEDGTFPARLTDAPCAAGDPDATAHAVRAINAMPAPAASTQPGEHRPIEIDPQALAGAANTAPASWPSERSDRLQQTAFAVLGATSRTGLPVDDPVDNELAVNLAASRQVLGLDIANTTRAVGRAQRPDGGFTVSATAPVKVRSDLLVSVRVASAIAGRTWISAQDSPLVTAVHLPLAEDTAPAPVATEQAPWGPPSWFLAVAAVLLLAAGLGTGLAGHHLMRRARTSPAEASDL